MSDPDECPRCPERKKPRMIRQKCTRNEHKDPIYTYSTHTHKGKRMHTELTCKRGIKSSCSRYVQPGLASK